MQRAANKVNLNKIISKRDCNLGRKSSLISEDDMKDSFLFLESPVEDGWLELATIVKALPSAWLQINIFVRFILFFAISF